MASLTVDTDPPGRATIPAPDKPATLLTIVGPGQVDPASLAWPYVPVVSPPPAAAVRCLGPFQLCVDGVLVENWRPGKARTLFQYLVTNRNRPIHRDKLIAALWPESDGIRAATSLKVTVHTLRGVLSQLQPSSAPTLTISSEESGYQLRTGELWLDVEQFEQLYATGRTHEKHGQHEAALQAYAQAAECYRGEFLPDAWDDWVLFRRESLKDEYLFVLVRLADAAFVTGDYVSCLHHCQQLLAQDHCREDTYRMLMVCHARLGQLGRVRRWYELCVRVVASELDTTPEPETEQILQQALAGKFAPRPLVVTV